MIQAAVWNVRGLNRGDHQHAVNMLVNEFHLYFIGILETRVVVANLTGVKLERVCKLVVVKATKLEQNMLQQRSKLQWLKGGDQCTRFFSKGCARRTALRVFQINNLRGELLTSPQDVRNEFVGFYEQLLGRMCRLVVVQLDHLRPWTRHLVTEEEGIAMLQPVSRDEIKITLFDIAEDKAPGPDGYSSGFFKVVWPIVGEEMFHAIMEFFHSGKILKQLNATLITLIPKVQLPSNVAEYRPISCCNVLYKIEECVTTASFSVCLNGVGVQGGLDWFSGVSGLQANPDKSRLILSKSTEHLRTCLHQVDKRIAGWTSIPLSFVGRVQLIKTVLSALHTYWSASFVLPKGIIKLIEKKMRKFPWQGTSDHGYAKVAWSQVCIPYDEGGQGIRAITSKSGPHDSGTCGMSYNILLNPFGYNGFGSTGYVLSLFGQYPD
ncbi:UNVERIFIED_CONTAM: hypothetical protein Sangu_2591500 [Sesamum angustifolium]|uniref:Reverse transcriptase n=1 Tax=Sesamum angustifolium TaxID=2727405 RepID=A0AAW2J8V0_9LAMI